MGSGVDPSKVWELQRKLNEFLEEHPELREYQDKITKTLQGAGSSHNRLVLLRQMMVEKTMEIQEKFQEIQSLCQKVIDKSK